MSRYNPARRYDRQHQENADHAARVTLLEAAWAELQALTGPLTGTQAAAAVWLVQQAVDYNPARSPQSLAAEVAKLLTPDSTKTGGTV